jgi:hypothetical protein
MADKVPLPPTPEQSAWVYKQISEMAAFCALCTEISDKESAADDFGGMLALFQVNAMSLSAQGIAEWQNAASEILTIVVEEVEHHASDRERGADRGPRGNFYHTLAMSLRAIVARSRDRAH